MLRTILAVVAGYAVMFILTMTLFAVLSVTAPDAFADPTAFPDSTILLIILGSALVTAILAGSTTCIVATEAPFKHATLLSIVALALGIFSAITNPLDQPFWYHLTLIGLSILGIYAGTLLVRLVGRASQTR